MVNPLRRLFKKKPKSHPDPKTMSPLEAMRYALNVIKDEWPEAEPIIMQDPEAAYFYALDVLKEPWPEAEPIIMKDWIYALLYDTNVVKKGSGGKGSGGSGFFLGTHTHTDTTRYLEEGKKKKKGLWDNIHAKRARGEKPAKKGDPDFPDPKSWKKAQGKKEGKISPKKKMEESRLVESISNFLRDDAHLGFPGKKDYKERFSLTQRMMEDMYEELALKFVDSPFYESVTRAFRKIHSYKYVSNPTFKLSLISELRSTAVPEEVIEETCKAIDELSKKAEKDANWNMDQLYKIVDMTRNANRRDIKHEDPFNTPLSESKKKLKKNFKSNN